MNASRTLTTAGIIILSALWIFRDALADTVCDGINQGCYQTVTVPCAAGAGTCAAVSGITTPGGIQNCKDGTSATDYTFTPPNTWTDCVTNASTNPKYGPCLRTPSLCGTVYLFKSKDDCSNTANNCLANPINACKQSDGQTQCK